MSFLKELLLYWQPMPKQIEIEFFVYLQKIGETLAHLLSIKQSKFQLHKIKLHAIVIVK